MGAVYNGQGSIDAQGNQVLAESAQQHEAMGEEPNVVGARKPDAAPELVNERRCTRRSTAWQRRGAVTAWSRPDLVLAAPAGIAALTPAAFVASAGNASTLVAGQDMQFAAQAHHAWAVKSGLVVYTCGKATVAATRLTADKSVAVSSTGGMVRVAAPQHILLTAAGVVLPKARHERQVEGRGAAFGVRRHPDYRRRTHPRVVLRPFARTSRCHSIRRHHRVRCSSP